MKYKVCWAEVENHTFVELPEGAIPLKIGKQYNDPSTPFLEVCYLLPVDEPAQTTTKK